MNKISQIDNFDVSFLWSGLDYEIDNNVIVRHPKVGDILKLGAECERQYMSMLNTIALNVFERKVMLWQIGIDYTKVDNYTAFCNLFYLYSEMQKNNMIKENIFAKALSFFLGSSDSSFFLANDKDDLCFIDLSYPERIIDKNHFTNIQRFLRSIHMWSMKEEGLPADESTKKDLIEYELEMLNDNSEYESFLGNIISSVSDLDTDLTNIPIYRLFNKFKRKMKEIDYKTVMSGFYNGTIKLTPSQQNDILWYGKL
jgi:hypothetical protein